MRTGELYTSFTTQTKGWKTFLPETEYPLPGGGGEGTPYNDLYGEAPPERGIFFRLQVFKRVGTLLVEVYERAGKSVMRVCERAQRVNR